MGEHGTPAASSKLVNASRVRLANSARQQRIEVRMIADPRRVCRETLVPNHSGVAQYFCELCELAIVADRQRDKAVGAWKDILRLDIRVAVAAALRGVAGDEPVHGLVGQKRGLHVQHGEIDVVALPSLVAPGQRRHTPTAAYIPVIRSTMGTPTFCGRRRACRRVRR